MTTEKLIRQFNEQRSGEWAASESQATPASIRRIGEHFGIALPPLLVELARRSHYFTRRFASLGRNYDDPEHIIRINSYWRRRRRMRRVPRGFVILNNDRHDDDYWCLDTAAACGDGAIPVQFWSPQPRIYASESQRPVERYADFETFLRADLYWRDYWQNARKRYR